MASFLENGPPRPPAPRVEWLTSSTQEKDQVRALLEARKREARRKLGSY